ncbi:MAG: LssY C-terminal domain-containing protein [Bryobacteraceae bacterium]
MAPLLYLMLSMNMLAAHELPAGTQLHVRLINTVGSYASKVGTPVKAVLIAPALADNEVLLPVGSVLSGAVKAVNRVGYGIRHETATLDLAFTNITFPLGDEQPLSARVSEVDTGRESVNRRGNIQELRSTSSISYRITGYIRTALTLDLHYQVASWLIKSLIVQVPEPEIYFPAGVELTVTLNKPLMISQPADEEAGALHLSCAERAELVRLAEELPFRTTMPKSNRPSDVTNLMFVGTREEIAAAFRAAGWKEAERSSFHSQIRLIRAVGESGGYTSAPMSQLLLDGTPADMSWEKGLNDVSKRHHIRIWKQSVTWQGQEVWVGAATRDVDFAVLRAGKALSHHIDENVDAEREKVVFDLQFTSCAKLVDWTERAQVPNATRNGTGDPVTTDAQLAVVMMNKCRAPRFPTAFSVDPAPVPMHGSPWQRFARREILVTRNDLMRNNIYWRGFEVSRWTYLYLRDRHRKHVNELAMAKATGTAEHQTSGSGIASSTRKTGIPVASVTATCVGSSLQLPCVHPIP